MDEIVKHWADIVVACMAVAAVFISLRSLKVSREAFALTKAQDDRRQPNLVPYLQDSQVERLPNGEGRAYAFNLSVSNRSDADNAIAGVELHVTYTVGEVPITAKVPLYRELQPAALLIPAKVAAHNTISGWAYFHLRAEIVGDASIDALAVVLTDSHGLSSPVEAQIILERRGA